MASHRQIRIPAASVLELDATLRREVGAEAATRALQNAGHAAGDVFFDRLQHDDALDTTPQATFWTRLSALFKEMGWGTVEHQEVHPGVGALTAREWFEIDPHAGTPTCPFSTGVLAKILGRVADREVAVMVVPCADGSPGCCRFLFGSGPILQQVHAELRGGGELETALNALG